MPRWPFSRKPHADSLTAAAVELIEDGPAAFKARTGEDSWQREAWRHYDICGELRYATNWISNSISLADMHAAEIDPATGMIAGPTDDPRVQAVAATVLGGPDRRPQAQATIATNWQVAGEVFIIIRPQTGGQPDKWLILSSTEVSERSGAFTYNDPVTGKKVELTARDKIIRHWNPHPSRQVHADSAVRAALPILNEIERTSQNIAARLVSRIASNGVWLLPQEIDFPKNDSDPTGPQGVMDWLARAGEAAMRDVGQASSQMPLVLQIPAEQIAAASDGLVEFASELSAEVLELRTAAIKRLATSMDMPMEIMTGMGDSNHWSAWQIEEAAFKVHIAPDLDRLAETLTEHYFRPVLAQMGVANPERYVLAFDTTEIISRPNRTEEMLQLHALRLISDDFMRAEAGVPELAAPSDEERARRLLESLLPTDTALLADPAVRDCLDLECDVAPAASTSSPQPVNDVPDNVRALPARPTQADESDEPDAALVAAAELAVFDALSRAGARMLTREYRGNFASTPKHELYRALPVRVDIAKAETLLADSFAFTDTVADAARLDPKRFRDGLRAYTGCLLLDKEPHDRQRMMQTMRAYGYGR